MFMSLVAFSVCLFKDITMFYWVSKYSGWPSGWDQKDVGTNTKKLSI